MARQTFAAPQPPSSMRRSAAKRTCPKVKRCLPLGACARRGARPGPAQASSVRCWPCSAAAAGEARKPMVRAATLGRHPFGRIGIRHRLPVGWRVEHAGRDAVDVDAVRRKLGRRSLDKALQRALGGNVGRHGRQAARRCLGGDGNHAAGLALDHRRHQRLRNRHERPGIQVHHAIPGRTTQGVYRLAHLEAARDMDERIDLLEGGEDARCRLGHRRHRSDVAPRAAGAGSCRAPEKHSVRCSIRCSISATRAP